MKSNLRPIDAVIKPSAQSSKPCAPDKEVDNSESIYMMHRCILKNYCPEVEIIYCLQFSYGLRISEVLNIKTKHISPRGTILIKGAKGSFDKMVDMPEFYSFFKNCRVSGRQPFEGFSRWFVYRTYKKLAINFGIKYGSLNAVTHQFRYLKARDTQALSNDMELTQRTMGHKNQKSTKHYV